MLKKESLIELVRGDSYTAVIAITDEDGDEYELEPGDELYFAVKKFFDDPTYIIEPRILDTNILRLSSEDTKGLSFGDYVYNIKLVNGITQRTVVGPAVMRLLPEVPIDV
jgi:hypothetical protein